MRVEFLAQLYIGIFPNSYIIYSNRHYTIFNTGLRLESVFVLFFKWC